MLRHLHIASLPRHLRSTSFSHSSRAVVAELAVILVGWLHSLSARACRLRSPPHGMPTVQPNHRARHTAGQSTHPPHRQLISLVFTSPWRACDMHTRIKSTRQTARLTARNQRQQYAQHQKPPSHISRITQTHHASRLCHGSFHRSSAPISGPHATARPLLTCRVVSAKPVRPHLPVAVVVLYSASQLHHHHTYPASQPATSASGSSVPVERS